MQKYVIIGVGAAAIGFAAFLAKAASRPKEFYLQRSILTSASAADIYAVLSDFRRYPEWSPWQKADPNMSTEVSGEPGTIGAEYRWDGNVKVGAGCMTVTDLEADRFVRIQLDFSRPFAASNMATWRVDEENGQRRITWSMDGSNDTLFERAFAMVANMDKMVGKDFEAGLNSLKNIVEAA